MRNGGREAARGGLRVLLVEDAPDIREVFTVLLRGRRLRRRGHRQRARAAKLAAARRRPRVIVVTGYDEPFVSRARQAGADAVFTKPVVWSTLAGTLAEAGERLAAA